MSHGCRSFWLGQPTGRLLQTSSAGVSQGTVFPWALPVLQAMVMQQEVHVSWVSSYVTISARPASDDLDVSRRLRIRISRLWCAASLKYPRSFMMYLLLTCCLYHSRSASAPSPTKPSPCTKNHNRRDLCRWTYVEYSPCEKLLTSTSSRTTNSKACPAPHHASDMARLPCRLEKLLTFCVSLEQQASCGIQVWVCLFVVVVPLCSERRSSHVSHCISMWFRQAFSELQFILSCGANCDGVESHFRVHVTEFRFRHALHFPP